MASKKIQPGRRNKVKVEVLNPKQQLFVAELLASESFNGTEAAKKVGYNNPSQTAFKLMNNTTVQKAIGKALTERLVKVDLRAQDVLTHLTTALFLDPMELFDCNEHGEFRLRSMAEVPPHIRRCITKIKGKKRYDPETEETETTFEIEFMSKDKALELAMRHLGLLQDTLKLKGEVTVEFLSTLREHVEGKGAVVGIEEIDADD